MSQVDDALRKLDGTLKKRFDELEQDSQNMRARIAELEQALAQAQADAAVMREALNDAYVYTGAVLRQAELDVVSRESLETVRAQAEKALSTHAGRELLEEVRALKELEAAARRQREHFARWGEERLTVHDVTAVLAVNKALEALDRLRGAKP